MRMMKSGKPSKLKRITPLTKVLNGKRVHLCDYHGNCMNKAHREVYPMLLKGKNQRKGWSYLCRKHFQQEQKRYRGQLPHCSVD